MSGIEYNIEQHKRFLGMTAAMTQVPVSTATVSGASFYYVRPYLPSAAYKSIMSNNPRGYEVFKSR